MKEITPLSNASKTYKVCVMANLEDSQPCYSPTHPGVFSLPIRRRPSCGPGQTLCFRCESAFSAYPVAAGYLIQLRSMEGTSDVSETGLLALWRTDKDLLLMGLQTGKLRFLPRAASHDMAVIVNLSREKLMKALTLLPSHSKRKQLCARRFHCTLPTFFHLT